MSAVAKDVCRLVLVVLILDLVILPLMCHKWNHCRYFGFSTDQIRQIVLREYSVRLEEAQLYFNQTIFDGLDGDSSTDMKSQEEEKEKWMPRLLVLVLSVSRTNADYLIQSAAALHQQITRTRTGNASLLICNANLDPETHSTAQYLSHLLPVVSITKAMRSSHCCPQGQCAEGLHLVKEKADYFECASAALRMSSADYLLIVQDDAIVRERSLDTISHLISSGHLRRWPSWQMAKLFYPSNYRGFEKSLESIVELMAFTLLLTCGLYIMYSATFKSLSPDLSLARWALIWAAVVFIVVSLNRQNTIIALRQRILPFSFRPGPAGSLTAVLYPRKALTQTILPFLHSQISCDNFYPLDFAIHDFLEQNHSGVASILVEGHFFDHVGYFSSLSGTKDVQTQMFGS